MRGPCPTRRRNNDVREVRGQPRPEVAEGLQGNAAVEEVRGERFKAKSTPQREHDATATGWGMAEGVSGW